MQSEQTFDRSQVARQRGARSHSVTYTGVPGVSTPNTQINNLSPEQTDFIHTEEQTIFDEFGRTANLSSKSALDSYGGHGSR